MIRKDEVDKGPSLKKPTLNGTSRLKRDPKGALAKNKKNEETMKKKMKGKN